YQAEPAPKGRVLFDATVCPQDIAYPTDLELLNESREKTEALIDVLYDQSLHASKPRTYRVRARRDYLKVARKRRRSKAEMRRAIGKQLNYVKRNLRTDRKSTRLNSSHVKISYAVFCLKKKNEDVVRWNT